MTTHDDEDERSVRAVEAVMLGRWHTTVTNILEQRDMIRTALEKRNVDVPQAEYDRVTQVAERIREAGTADVALTNELHAALEAWVEAVAGVVGLNAEGR